MAANRRKTGRKVQRPRRARKVSGERREAKGKRVIPPGRAPSSSASRRRPRKKLSAAKRGALQKQWAAAARTRWERYLNWRETFTLGQATKKLGRPRVARTLRVFEVGQTVILEAMAKDPFRDFSYLPNRRELANRVAKGLAKKIGVSVRTMYQAIMSPKGYLRMFPYARLRGVPIV